MMHGFTEKLKMLGSATDESAKKCGKGGASFRQSPRHRIEIAPIDIAPAPGLAGLEGGDHRVAGLVEMLERMRVLRILAAADVAAGQANAELVPWRADRHAIHATVGARPDLADLAEVLAALGRLSHARSAGR